MLSKSVRGLERDGLISRTAIPTVPVTVDDPGHGPLGALVVWNDDQIAPATGFDFHGHKDMEIISYVREGAVTHQDTLGSLGRTEAGDV
jgi:redox-sensitive bicupin YhaK (pirin superfamily)